MLDNNIYEENIKGIKKPNIFKETEKETKKAITRATTQQKEEQATINKLKTFNDRLKKELDKQKQLINDNEDLKNDLLNIENKKERRKIINEIKSNKKKISASKKNVREFKIKNKTLTKSIEKIQELKKDLKELEQYKKTYEDYLRIEKEKKELIPVIINFTLYTIRPEKWKESLRDVRGEYATYREKESYFNFEAKFDMYIYKNIIIGKLYEAMETAKKYNDIILQGYIDNYLLNALTKNGIENMTKEESILYHNLLYNKCAIKFISIKEEILEDEEENIEYYEDIPFELEENIIIDSNYNKFVFNSNTDIKPYYYDNDYLRTNYIKNSCGLTALIYCFGSRMEKLGYKKLTYKLIAEKLEIELKEDSNPIYIRHLRNFIKNVNLPFKIVLLDTYLNVKEIIQKQTNQKILNTAYFQLYNKHITPLLQNTENLEQILSKTEQESKLSKYYTHYKYKKDTTRKEIFINDCLKFEEFIKNLQPKTRETKEKYILYVYNEPELRLILFKLMTQYKYKPSIRTSSANLKEIRLNNITNYKIIVKSMMDDEEGQNILNTFEEEPEENEIIKHTNIFKEIEEEFYNIVLNPRYISSFNNDTLKLHNTYKISIEAGMYKEDDNINLFGLDDIKAYSSRLNSLEWFPQIDIFDNYKTFTGDKIINNNWYIVEYIGNIPDKIDNIVFNGSNIARILGLLLKKVNPSKYKILSELKTHKYKINFKNAIKKVYDDPKICETQKKFIVNKIIGCLNIKNNTMTTSNIFITREEARGQLKILRDKGINASLKEFIQPVEYLKEFEPLYLIEEYQKQQTINNYTQIHEMILTLQKIRIIENIRELNRHKIEVLGIKTDCIFIDVKHLNNSIIQDKINKSNTDDKTKLYNTLGGYKIEKDIMAIKKRLTIKEAPKIDLKELQQTNIKTFEDEYNINEIKNYIDKTDNVLIRAKYPGSGKSYICRLLSQNKNDIQFITPTNILSLEYKKDEYKAKTSHKLLGVNMDLSKQTKPKKDNTNKYIVFDEIYLFSYDLLKLIYRYIQDNPEYKYIATGDPNQRDAIGSNPEDIERAINYIFNNQIYLTVIKRQNKDQIERIQGIYKDIFENNIIDPKIICKKYNIKMITDDKTMTNKHITFFREEAEIQNNKVLEKLGKSKYDIGNYLLVKEGYRNNGLILYNNYKFKISKRTKEKIYLLDENENKEYIFTPDFVDKHFKNEYSQTLDSLQGLTIKEPYTIHNSQSNYIDKKFIWTAITRADNLDNIYFKLKTDILDEI